ncbi:MAG: flagellar export chaperone FliS [Deltaproteobacteria bacterium]|nr:flagellar export chaperone FliS [Deltaproteobacteria bacterium]MBW2071771.1 flagellar export chaperone FliS [Deltaproteobacteria bacterium]
MDMNSGINSYKSISVNTADPLKLVVMCYEHAIQALNNAIEHYHNKQYFEKTQQLNKAQAIINELMSSLDMEQGEQIASNLSSLYAFMQKTILDADMHRDTAKIEKVVEMLHQLLDAWKAVAADARAKDQVSYGTAAAAEMNQGGISV